MNRTLNDRAELWDSTPGPPRTRGASRHGERPSIELVYFSPRFPGDAGKPDASALRLMDTLLFGGESQIDIPSCVMSKAPQATNNSR